MHGLDEVSRKQFGLVSRAQAIAVGLSEDAIRWRLERKEWEVFRPLVYRFRGTTVTWSQLAMGALLAAGPGSALSHKTAAFLFKLDGLKRDRPRVIDVSTNRHRSIARPGVLHHRLREKILPTTVTQGLTTTTLARTLVDLAGILSPHALELALDSARRDHPQLPDELEDYARTISHRRQGLTLLMKLLAERMSPYDSPFEVEVFKELELRGLPTPIAGYSIYDDHGRYVMKADAAWKDQKVALHMDSYRYHHHRERFERDARQRNALALLEWTNVVVTKRSLADQGWSDTLKRLLLPPEPTKKTGRMRLWPWAVAVLINACAEVPAAICFADEPCADAGSAGGGGGSTGGGTGGGTVGGGGGGGDDAGAPVPNRFSSLGITDTWPIALGEFPQPTALPPVFNPTPLALTPPIVMSGSCTEAFRGAVALPGGKVLAIPFCANQFALIDPELRLTQWVGAPVTPGFQAPLYGGAVLGCDGRVYALPHEGATTVKRITPEADGGFTFDELPMSLPGPHFFSGGVIARPCTAGFRIIAAGKGGLYALDPTETSVTVRPIRPPQGATLLFNGVARIGDTGVISAPSGSGMVSLYVDSNTLVPTPLVSNVLGSNFGIASRRDGDAFLVSEGAFAYPFSTGGEGAIRSFGPASRQRWPTNSLTGWVFTSGNSLMAWAEQPGVDGGTPFELFNPASSDTGSFTSGGLVLTEAGHLVSVPSTTGASAITIYELLSSTAPPRALVLSPWFNKL